MATNPFFDWATKSRFVRFDTVRSTDANAALDLVTAGFDTVYASTLEWRGNWATATAYTVNDVYKDPSSKNLYITVVAHTSGASIAADLAASKVALAVNVSDVEASAAAALASKNAAAASAVDATNNGAAQVSLATTQAGIATTQAGLAATAKTDAETARTGAQTAQTAAEAALDSFDDRYLGAKAADPTLDNDGNALLEGALYWNTTNKNLKAYNGSAWIVPDTGTYLALAGGTMTGAVNLATGANIASAATLNLDTATGNRVHVTGTTTITAVTLTRGPRTVIFDGALTLTHHATNNNLPGAANITTAAGDRAIYESDGTTTYCVAYIRAAASVSDTPVLSNPITYTSYSATFASTPGTTLSAISLDADRDLLLLGGDNQLHAVVVNNTTGSIGSPVLVRAAAVLVKALLSAANQVLVASVPSGGTTFEAVVLSVSGTTITVGTAATAALASGIAGANPFAGPMIQVGSSYIVSYGRSATTGLRAMTISGTTVTIGAEVNATSAGSVSAILVAVSSTVFLAMSHNTPVTLLYASPYTVSAGTTLTLGTEATTASTSSTTLVGMGQLASGRFAFGYTNPTAYGAIVNVAGTVATMTVVDLGGADWSNCTYVVSGSQVLCSMANGAKINVLTDNAGTAVAGTAITPTSTGACSIIGSSLVQRFSSASGSYFKYTISGNNPARSAFAGPYATTAAATPPSSQYPIYGIGYSNASTTNALYTSTNTAPLGVTTPLSMAIYDGSASLIACNWYTGTNSTTSCARLSASAAWLLDSSLAPTIKLYKATLA